MNKKKNDTREADLGRDPVGPLLVRLALPTICAQVVNLLYNIVDRIYIGRIPDEGALALTGMGVTFPVITLIAAFAALIGMGGAPRASIAMGAGEHEKAERTLGTCTAALWALAVVLTAVFLLFQEPLLVLFGASADTLPYAMQYLNIYVLGTIFVMTALGLNGFITAQGKSGVAMKTVLIGAVLNVVLDPVFIFLFGMGVRGAAVATVISQAVSALWVVRFLVGPSSELRLKKAFFRLDRRLLWPAVALGASPFVMQSTESLLTVTFNVSLQKYGGDLAVGAMTILTSVMQMMQMPLLGLMQGAQPILSFNYGAGNSKRMKEVIRYSVLIGAADRRGVCVLRLGGGTAFPADGGIPVQPQAGTGRDDRVGAADLYGGGLYCGVPVGVPAVVRRSGGGENILVPCAGAQDHPSDPTDPDSAALL